MKRFLIFLACLGSFVVIVTLCYFFGYPRYEQSLPEGKYYLTSTFEGFEEEEGTESDYVGEPLYLEVIGKKIKSYSGSVGMTENEKEYTYSLVGTGVKVYLDKEITYKGLFTENVLIITIKERRQVEGEEKNYLYQYFYVLEGGS